MKLLVSIIVFLFSSSASAETVDKVVAIVNDEIITELDLSNYKKQLQKGRFVDDLLIRDKDRLLKDRTSLINHLIDERIIDSEVKRQDLSITVERLDQEVRKIAQGNRMTKAQLAETLKKEGVSFSDYQNFIKQKLERQALIQKSISSKIKITDEEIQNFYLTTHSGGDLTSYEYSLAHILFLPKGGDKGAAKARADVVLEKIKKGEPFDSLASQYSEDPNFSAGGFLGNFKSGEFLKELEVAAKGLAPGEHSNIVTTKLGYHVIKLLSKKIIKDPAFEARKKEIQNILYEKAFAQQFKFWIEQKKLESFVRINK